MTSAVLGQGTGALLRATLNDHLGPGTPRLVVIGLSRDENPKATILAFEPARSSPRLVLKVSLGRGAVPAVLAEAAALAAVAELGPDLVGGTVPSLVDVRQDATSAVLVTTVVPGVPMSVDYHGWRHTARPSAVREDLTDAVSWLDELARVPVRDVAVGNRSADARTQWTPSALTARLWSRWPDDAVARTVGDAVCSVASELALPLDATGAIVHGDFWCGNVLRTGGIVTGVVDWEHAVVGGDPLRDVTRFVLAYVLYLDRHTRAGRTVGGHPGLVAGPWGEPVRYVAAGSGWLSEAVEAVVAGHLANTGRDPMRWRQALALAAAEVAALADEREFARRHLLLAAGLFPCC
jgi:aminoglycoside phosphotransferase (APT) family kinase protein